MHSKLSLHYKVKCALRYCPYIICIILFSIPIIIDLITKDHYASSCLASKFGFTNKDGSTKDFYTFWIALWGVISIVINIIHSQIRIQNQDKQIDLQSKSQRDSRFSKGIELLGNDNESARTGAAYSLCFLAKDYPDEFSKPVFDILCSHIRTLTTSQDYLKRHPTVSNEIQTILNLLFKDANGNNIMAFSNYIADLRGTHLGKADLERGYLRKANLYKTNLEEANLEEANLEEANLEEANLEKANLVKTNLINANLNEANLEGANICYANLQTADLRKANLAEANLKGANLAETNLLIANLEKANLERGYLLLANLAEANLVSANLEGAHMEGANIYHANLKKANLKKTHLKKANFRQDDSGNAYIENFHLKYSYITLNWKKSSEINRKETTILDRSNLEEANLEKANLEGVSLRKAHLERSNMEGANLKEADLKGVFISSSMRPSLEKMGLDLSGVNWIDDKT